MGRNKGDTNTAQHWHICNCGKHYKSRSIMSYYCSASCRQKAYRQRKGIIPNHKVRAQKASKTKYSQQIELSCSHCGETYSRNGHRAQKSQYCSNGCKQSAYRLRKAIRANTPSLWKCGSCGNTDNLKKVLRQGWKLSCECGAYTAL